jgi:crotonobetainyl-CoA:carnitine CoA-transferase CaiB-like acyl-CoA transferase
MTGPLDGIRVLDLSRLLPGGYCSLLLADYGADVLKVEDTGAGDYIARSPATARTARTAIGPATTSTTSPAAGCSA